MTGGGKKRHDGCPMDDEKATENAGQDTGHENAVQNAEMDDEEIDTGAGQSGEKRKLVPGLDSSEDDDGVDDGFEMTTCKNKKRRKPFKKDPRGCGPGRGEPLAPVTNIKVEVDDGTVRFFKDPEPITPLTPEEEAFFIKVMRKCKFLKEHPELYLDTYGLMDKAFPKKKSEENDEKSDDDDDEE